LAYNVLMIGILSDSHDNLIPLRAAVRLFRNAGCDLVIHAGDFVAPFAARELGGAGAPVRAVYGNCDGEKAGLAQALEPFGRVHEPPFVFEHAGRTLLVVHVQAKIQAYAAEKKYDLIVYGHTHKPEVRRVGETILINPGESGGWVNGRSSVALFDPDSGDADIVYL